MARRPRVACLHGQGGNERILRLQLAKLTVALRDLELLVVEGGIELTADHPNWDAPGVVQMRELPLNANSRLLTYATRREDARGATSFDAPLEALEALEGRLHALGEVEAVIGFSVGADLAVCLAARAEAGAGCLPPFRFLLLLEPDSPAYHVQQELSHLFASPLRTPALVVAAERGEGAKGSAAALGRICAAPRLLAHAEGHRPLPSDREAVAGLVDSASSFLREHLAAPSERADASCSAESERAEEGDGDELAYLGF